MFHGVLHLLRMTASTDKLYCIKISRQEKKHLHLPGSFSHKNVARYKMKKNLHLQKLFSNDITATEAKS